MIKYLTVSALEFDRGELSDKELEKRVRFASKKQYSELTSHVINRDYYTKRAIKTQILLKEMKKYPYTMLVSFLEDYKGGKYGLNKKYPQGLCDIFKACKGRRLYKVNDYGERISFEDYEYALSILPLRYRNA